MNSFGNLFASRTFEDLNIKLRALLEPLGEPKNFAIATSSIAATFVLYKVIQSRNDAKRSFPNFEGASRFQDQRPLLMSSSHMLDFWQKVNPKNLPVGYSKFSYTRILTICDLRYLKELFLTHGVETSGRTGGIRAHMGDEYQHGVLFSVSETWKNNRRIFLNFLRQWGRENQIDLILQESQFLNETFENKGGPFSPVSLLENAACNIISTFIFGSRMEYDDPESEEVFATFLRINQKHDRLPEFFWWLLIRFPIFAAIRERKAAIKKTKNFIRRKIEGMIISGLRDPPETLVEAYALDMQSRDGKKLDLGPLIVLIYELFFAGTETTSTTLQWFFACMAAYPEIQERVFQEIESVVGSAKLNSRVLKDLPYFTAVQHEIQRFGSIVQGTVFHTALDQITTDSGHVIKKGEILQGGISWVLQDKKYWKNSHEFYPENFLDQDGKFQGHDAFVPYGVGPRICLGNQLADLEIKVFMFEVIRKFKISCDEPMDLSRRTQKITCAPYHYKYKLTAR